MGGDYREPKNNTEHMYGTAQYIAPEQYYADTDSIAGAADQHALAATLYKQFTLASNLYEEKGIFTIETAHVKPSQRLVKPDGLPEEIYSIFAKALSYNSEERYKSCSDFIGTLKQVLDKHPEYQELDTNDLEITTQYQGMRQLIHDSTSF